LFSVFEKNILVCLRYPSEQYCVVGFLLLVTLYRFGNCGTERMNFLTTVNKCQSQNFSVGCVQSWTAESMFLNHYC
jgi:hypothetical protein